MVADRPLHQWNAVTGQMCTWSQPRTSRAGEPQVEEAQRGERSRVPATRSRLLGGCIQCKAREGTSRLLFSYAPEPCDGGNRLEMRRLPGFADASIERSPGDEKRWSGEGR